MQRSIQGIFCCWLLWSRYHNYNLSMLALSFNSQHSNLPSLLPPKIPKHLAKTNSSLLHVFPASLIFHPNIKIHHVHYPHTPHHLHPPLPSPLLPPPPPLRSPLLSSRPFPRPHPKRIHQHRKRRTSRQAPTKPSPPGRASIAATFPPKTRTSSS